MTGRRAVVYWSHRTEEGRYGLSGLHPALRGLYTGCTNDLPRRLQAHQSGRGAKYTRSRLPVELVYQEAVPDRSAALRREAAIKRLDRRRKLALIAAFRPGTAEK